MPRYGIYGTQNANKPESTILTETASCTIWTISLIYVTEIHILLKIWFVQFHWVLQDNLLLLNLRFVYSLLPICSILPFSRLSNIHIPIVQFSKSPDFLDFRDLLYLFKNF